MTRRVLTTTIACRTALWGLASLLACSDTESGASGSTEAGSGSGTEDGKSSDGGAATSGSGPGSGSGSESSDAASSDASDTGSGTGTGPGGGTGRLVGYFTNWAQYRPGECAFTGADIDADLLTHISYAFAKVEVEGTQQAPTSFFLAPYEWNDIGAGGQYEQVNALKTTHPGLETLISVGGWTFSQDGATSWIFPTVAADAGFRAQLGESAVSYAREHGFDGIDIDWEYPGAADTESFTLLLQALRQAIEDDAATSGEDPLLLTIAAPAGEAHYANIDLAAIHGSLDWINVMTYDYHGAWDGVTGANAPLFADSVPGGNAYIDRTIEGYLAGGVPSEKLVLGFPTYGRTFAGVAGTGTNEAAPGSHAPGPCTQESGFLAYYEIRDLIDGGGYTEGWDATTSTPYAHDGQGGWITFDNPESYALKLDYLEEQGLGGAMVWAIDLDDFAAGSPLVSVLSQRLLEP